VEVSQLRVDSGSTELFVRQSPAIKNVSTEAEDIFGIRHQTTAGEDIANREDSMCAYIISTDLNSKNSQFQYKNRKYYCPEALEELIQPDHMTRSGNLSNKERNESFRMLFTRTSPTA
jgi:hypothetical protein